MESKVYAAINGVKEREPGKSNAVFWLKASKKGTDKAFLITEQTQPLAAYSPPP